MNSDAFQDFRVAKNDEIPTLEFYQRAFNKFRKKIRNLSEYEDIKNAFVSSFDVYPPIGLVPNVSVDSDMYVYRARLIDTLTEDITAINTYSYNHNKSQVKIGRANLEGFPVFYGAVSQDTAIRETKVTHNDNPILYISKWRLAKGKKISTVNFIFDDSKIGLVEHTKSFNMAREERMKEMLNIYSSDKQEAFMYLFKEVGNIFFDEDYKISSFLAHYYLYEGKEKFQYDIDLILYPSIQSNYQGFNFAINPDFADRCLELVEVQKIRLKEYEKSGGSHIELLNTGRLDSSGKVEWFDVVLNSDNMQINRLGICAKGLQGKPVPIDVNTRVLFDGIEQSLEELMKSLIPMYFDEISESCWKGIDPDNIYGKHEIDIDLELEDGLMRIGLEEDITVSNLLLNIHYFLINEKIKKQIHNKIVL